MNPVRNKNYLWREKISNGMKVISLNTDFGLEDNFVGVVKGVILSINPAAKIVDICHKINPQDIPAAAFLLQASFKYFPCGSVHLVVVDPGVGSKRKKVVVKTKNYYFVAPDNGVLWPAVKDDAPQEIVEITNDDYFLKPTSDTFQARDIFAPIAAYLSKGVKISRFGRRIESIKELELPPAKIGARCLSGEVIYIDRFGNLISNIDKNTLDNFVKNKKFKICIKGKTINRLSHNYSEGIRCDPIALIDSFNYLEIALPCASAQSYLNANKGTKIEVIRI